MGVELKELSSLEQNYEDFKSVVQMINNDYEKFHIKKVKVSGQRCRNNLLTCKKLCDSLRKDILKEMKEMPVKSRNKKVEVPESRPSSPVVELDLEKGANGIDESQLPEEPVAPEEPEQPKKRTRKANKKKSSK